MKTWALFACVILILANYSADALTTLRKEVKQDDTVRQTLKQLDLPEAEIDPNIGPTLPNAEEAVAEAVDAALDVNADKPAVAAEDEIVAVAEETVAPVSSSPAEEEINPVNEDDPNQLSKYCKCSESHCDCCRDFQLPILPVRGPVCAKMTYLGNERMSVSIKYGDIILATRSISGKKAKPICVNLPGGFSKFCGRVYGLSKGKDDFKACLGLELRGEEEVEASIRVSCFKFGAKGLQVAEAEPLPEVPKEEEEDDDIFGFGGGGGTDDDYDDEDDEDDEDDAEDDDDDVPVGASAAAATDDADYDGLSFLGGDLLDGLDDSEETSSPVQATRNERNDIAQSKNGEGTPLMEVENALVEPSTATNDETKPKPDGTKVKKNKKKKKKANDSGFALDFLNEILEFFS